MIVELLPVDNVLACTDSFAETRCTFTSTLLDQQAVPNSPTDSPVQDLSPEIPSHPTTSAVKLRHPKSSVSRNFTSPKQLVAGRLAAALRTLAVEWNTTSLPHEPASVSTGPAADSLETPRPAALPLIDLPDSDSNIVADVDPVALASADLAMLSDADLANRTDAVPADDMSAEDCPADRRDLPRRTSAARVSICPRRRSSDKLTLQERTWQLHATRLSGELDDISLNAVAFWSNETLNTGDRLDLRLTDKVLLKSLDVSAEIVRISKSSRHGNAEQRIVCRLLRKLSYDEIEVFSHSLCRSQTLC